MATQPMAPKKSASGIVEDAKKIAVLATPIRIELVTTIQALGGAATVAELAVQLGRPADGLYYHLRALVRSGLAEECAEAGGRRYHLTTPRGQRMSLRYKPGATPNAKAVAHVAFCAARLCAGAESGRYRGRRAVARIMGGAAQGLGRSGGTRES